MAYSDYLVHSSFWQGKVSSCLLLSLTCGQLLLSGKHTTSLQPSFLVLHSALCIIAASKSELIQCLLSLWHIVSQQAKANWCLLPFLLASYGPTCKQVLQNDAGITIIRQVLLGSRSASTAGVKVIKQTQHISISIKFKQMAFLHSALIILLNMMPACFLACKLWGPTCKQVLQKK